jgi:hypothetical protein
MGNLIKYLFCTAMITSFTVQGVGATTPTGQKEAAEASQSLLVPVGQRQQAFSIFLTGYSYWDNTPPGSAAIARPVVHGSAGGSGTFNDPITIAVGYSLATGSARLDFPAGTRFYLPKLQRYAIVEDICGDGPTPEHTGCHRGRGGMPWLDIYVGGHSAGPGAANKCMNRITGTHQIIINPQRGYPVVTGALTESGCGVPTS